MLTGTRHHRKDATYNGYDVLVIGSGMGGLATAALLAKEGYKVLVLERHVQAGGMTQSFERAGFEWSVGLHYVGEVLKPTSVIRRLFDDISDGQLAWQPLPLTYNRIALGDQIYDQVAGRQAFQHRALSYFPDEAQAIHRYLDLIDAIGRYARSFYQEKLLPSGASESLKNDDWHTFLHWAGRTTREVLTELTRNETLIAYLCGHFGDYGLPPEESSFVYHAGVARHYHDGAGYPVGGSRAILESVAPVIHKHEGLIVTNAPVSEILVSNKRVRGVMLQDNTVIEAPIVVTACGVHTTRKLLGEQGFRLGGDDDFPSHSIAHVGLYLGLNRDDKSLGLNGSNIWAHPSSDLDGNTARYKRDLNEPIPWCFITFPSAKDPYWPQRHPGKATIEVTAPAYFEFFEAFANSRYGRREQGYLDLKRQFGERLLKVLLKFVPQIEPHIAHMEVSTPLSTIHYTGHSKGQILGIANNPQRLEYDWLRAPTAIGGLFLTGQDLVSDGVSTALLAGAFTASSITRQDIISRVFERANRSLRK